MSSVFTHVAPVSQLPVLAPSAWRDRVEGELRRGSHPLTLYGRTAADGVLVTAILEGEGAEVVVVRAVLDAEAGYDALTPEHPAMHAFERELHEQHGVRVSGHPWLKPLRFERSGWAGRDAYPFWKLEGKEVHEVAVGPVHAGVIEPGSFRFMCHGERVHHLEIMLGYQHRGIEAMLLQRDPRALAPLVETIAGDTSVAHTWAYAAAIEALAGASVDREIALSRGLLLELERVGMHLSGLAGMAADIAFLQGAATYGRLRTTAINTTMGLCGSRFGRGGVRPGGHGVALEDAPRDGAGARFTRGELDENIELLTRDLATIDACFLGASTVRHRLRGVGALRPELARSIGVVGMAARASGIARDVRALAGGVYAEPRIATHTEPSGDCWARARVRVEELRSSLAWIRAAIAHGPRLQPTRGALSALAPGHLALAVVEGWRGEVVHVLETGEDGRLLHYKVQDPSLRNWLGLALAVRDNDISDFPICNKSFDLSYCGHDL